MTGTLDIEVTNRSGIDLDTARADYVAGVVLEVLGYSSGELGISFVPVREMAALNRDNMGREGPTDVLAFPLDVGKEETSEGEEVPLLLGDVVICPEVAGRQAVEMGNDLNQEICLLVIHGLLHLAGYDHEIDEGEMDAKQAKMFEELCC